MTEPQFEAHTSDVSRKKTSTRNDSSKHKSSNSTTFDFMNKRMMSTYYPSKILASPDRTLGSEYNEKPNERYQEERQLAPKSYIRFQENNSAEVDLSSREFNAKKFLGSNISGFSESSVKDTEELIQRKLREGKEALRKSVILEYRNVERATKDINGIASDFEVLKALMHDLKNEFEIGEVNFRISKDYISDPPHSPSSKNSEEPVDQNDINERIHFKSLWKQIEGSYKLLPYVPGRQIVFQSANWYEINESTLIREKALYIVLLNDFILVAAKRNAKIAGMSPGNKQYFAYKSSELSKCTISAFKVPYNGVVDEQKTLLLHIADTKILILSKTVQDKTEFIEIFNRLSYKIQRNKGDYLQIISSEDSNFGQDSIKSMNSLDQAKEFKIGLSDLSISLIREDLKSSFKKIEGLKGNLARIVVHEIKRVCDVSLQKKSSEFRKLLKTKIHHDFNKPKELSLYFGWLEKLGHIHEGLERYFEVRSLFLHTMLSDLRCDYSALQYVVDLCGKFFWFVEKTIDVYCNSVDDKLYGHYLIAWIMTESEDLETLLECHLSSDRTMLGEIQRLLKSQISIFKRKGINMDFLFQNLLMTDTDWYDN